MTTFTRSVFRVAELSGGFSGHLANDQVSYMILEGAMIIIASLVLTIMHPEIGFGRVAWAEGIGILGRGKERSRRSIQERGKGRCLMVLSDWMREENKRMICEDLEHSMVHLAWSFLDIER